MPVSTSKLDDRRSVSLRVAGTRSAGRRRPIDPRHRPCRGRGVGSRRLRGSDDDRRPAPSSPTPRAASSSTSPPAAGRSRSRLATTLPRTIAFDAGSQGVAPIEIELIPREGFQERLEVTAPAPRPEGPASIPLRPKQVLSTAGSLDNPFRTLQTLPGVAGTDEFGSKLSVRGGAPDQNLTVMDGVEIHNPYRLFGLTSAFNPETVGRFELLAGGFGAKYGDRLSSVVLVENRDGDASRPFSGSSSVSITDANIIGEGRLPGPGQGSWLATARRTYYDLVAERFVDQDLPSFNDAQIKTAWQLPGSRRLSLLGLRSREITSIKPDDDTDGRAEIRSRNDLVTATLVSPLARASSTSIVAWSRNTDLIDIRDDRETSAAPGSEPRSVHASAVDRRPVAARGDPPSGTRPPPAGGRNGVASAADACGVHDLRRSRSVRAVSRRRRVAGRRVSGARRPLAEHHAGRRLDRGSRAAVVVRHAGSRAAVGLERPERARLAVAAVERAWLR